MLIRTRGRRQKSYSAVAGGALCASLALGCSSNGSAAVHGLDASLPDSGGRDAGAKLSFTSCTLLTDPSGTPVSPPGVMPTGDGTEKPASAIANIRVFGAGFDEIAGAMAECATMKVPAIWTRPEEGSIDVFVKRYRATMQPAKGQLWLLDGGPGFSGALFESLSFLIASTIPTLDIYLPDHRGTGRSTFAASASAPHLDGLTTTDAAKDVAALIDGSRGAGQDVFVMGSSYGTYWAQRYLQVRPDQPTAVILDSTLAAVDADLAQFGKQFDDVAHAVLALCRADSTCSANLGGDPLGFTTRVIADYDAGACNVVGPVREFLSKFLGDIAIDPVLLPASVYRLHRCSAADKIWLSKVSTYRDWWPGSRSSGNFFSLVVANNIGASELWPTQTTDAELRAQESSRLVVSRSGAQGAAGSWPRYPHDEYYGRWPTTSVAMLILQGTLDPRTPNGALVKTHYTGDNQYYVEVPHGGHQEAWPMVSPMKDLREPGCGWQIIRSFLENPTRQPDASCTSSSARLDFVAPPREWLAMIGIDDLWENTPIGDAGGGDRGAPEAGP